MVPHLSIFIILHFLALFPALSPSRPLGSCSPFPHLCNLDGKTHFRQLHPNGFDWPQSPCCSLCRGLYFLISSFKEQRKKFPGGRGQGRELEGTGNIFLTCSLRSFRFWCVLPSTRALLHGDKVTPPWCLDPYQWQEVFLLCCCHLFASSTYILGAVVIFQVL